MSDRDIDEAKKKLSPDALARALLARAEAAGMSLTEWLADEGRAAECRAAVGTPEGAATFFASE